MSLFFKPAAERRAVDMSAWMRGEDAPSRTRAGVSVTADKSLRVGAFWSSVHLLASIVSNLPVDVFRGSGVNKAPVSPQPTLVASPSLVVSRREWVYQAMVSLCLRGNAVGLVVERDPLLRPRTVEWLDPDVVTIEQKSSLERPSYSLAGQVIPFDDVVHLRAFVKPGSAVGMSPVQYHAETLGMNLAANQYGGQWFGDGAHPSAILKGDSQLSEEKAATVKARFKALLKGGREPLVLGQGWEYHAVQVSASDAGLLDALGYTDAQVARIFGPGIAEVLGYTTAGSSLTYSNRVDRSLDLLTYAVAPWVNKFEDFWTASIAQPQTARMNTNALLRMDPKARHEMYRIDREIGLYNIDELRALEDQPPLPDGLGADYTPLKQSGPNDGGSDAE